MVDSLTRILSMLILRGRGALCRNDPAPVPNEPEFSTNKVKYMKNIVSLMLGFYLATAISLPAQAEEYEAEDLIEYRHEVMEAIKGHNKAIKAILQQNVPYNDHLDMHMTSLEALLVTVGELFPEGSDFGETKAKDAVWDNPEKFKQSVDEAQKAFATFKSVVAAGDDRASLDAHKKFGKASCGSCHKSFKKKDD